MRKLITLFFAVALCGTFFISCEKKTIDLGSTDKPYNPSTAGDSVRFSTVIIPLFATNCTGCHYTGTGGRNPSLESGVAYSNLTATPGLYINVSVPNSSYLYVHISENPSSHGGNQFGTDVTNPILQWITQGARNN